MIDKSEILKSLKNTLIAIDASPYMDRSKYRLLGAAEGLLIALGAIKRGVPYEYKNVQYTRPTFFPWGKSKTTTRKESYQELILRVGIETVKKESNEVRTN